MIGFDSFFQQWSTMLQQLPQLLPLLLLELGIPLLILAQVHYVAVQLYRHN